MPNRLFDLYKLDESTVIVGASGVFFIFIAFFDENYVSKQNSLKLDVLLCHIWGYCVCIRSQAYKGLSDVTCTRFSSFIYLFLPKNLISASLDIISCQ